ncbi:MAG: UDP-N-acetylglucosamine 2-epimerase [Pseudomonadota bacterium]
MRLLFLTGSRGEWGYIRPILKLCRKRNIDFKLCVTNMHLLPAYGLSKKEIEADGFSIDEPIFMALQGSNHYTMAKSLGVCLMSLVDLLYRIRPDWVVLSGDRGEQLMGAVAGAYTNTPVAHIQAGEVSGNIDGQARHAIGKFVHMHFASNQDAADRLIRLGEEAHRVRLVGAPQLDELVQGEYTGLSDLKEKYDFPFDVDFILVLQHPVTEEYDKARDQIDATLSALKQFAVPKFWIMPNNDAGNEIVREGIVARRSADTFLIKNVKRQDFLGIMKACRCMVGNSSAGLLEAPTFKIPAVNIGRRQYKRVRGGNVIDVADFDADRIVAAIRQAFSTEFRQGLAGLSNPYGDGDSSERILEILQNTKRDAKLLIKELTY